MTLNNAIILSAGAFGSIYLFSTILKELNKYWLKNVKIPYSFYIIKITCIAIPPLIVI